MREQAALIALFVTSSSSLWGAYVCQTTVEYVTFVLIAGDVTSIGFAIAQSFAAAGATTIIFLQHHACVLEGAPTTLTLVQTHPKLGSIPLI
jgi:hypothetical protein